MKLTIVQTGAVPAPLQPHFVKYPLMFRRMFDQTGLAFSYDDVDAQADADAAGAQASGGPPF